MRRTERDTTDCCTGPLYESARARRDVCRSLRDAASPAPGSCAAALQDLLACDPIRALRPLAGSPIGPLGDAAGRIPKGLKLLDLHLEPLQPAVSLAVFEEDQLLAIAGRELLGEPFDLPSLLGHQLLQSARTSRASLDASSASVSVITRSPLPPPQHSQGSRGPPALTSSNSGDSEGRRSCPPNSPPDHPS